MFYFSLATLLDKVVQCFLKILKVLKILLRNKFIYQFLLLFDENSKNICKLYGFSLLKERCSLNNWHKVKDKQSLASQSMKELYERVVNGFAVFSIQFIYHDRSHFMAKSKCHGCIHLKPLIIFDQFLFFSILLFFCQHLAFTTWFQQAYLSEYFD